ncbi:hypothetical protein E8E13_007343 [Curvularia kusanoi]|uniref:Uncharacterized protein n=1 Tax=Curvularia kusanoi TaxID=90978 RepID=A0A9P4TEF1_CURKU|nr:hypothetical protein E8E13_007343 [Curvularia kusanoi]
MYQRNVCPTVGALRRTFAADVAAAPRSSSRAFSASARRFDEPKDAAPASAAPAQDSRKARAANALKQISRLGANRRAQPGAGGLAKGNFPSGQLARGPRPAGELKITREPSGPTTGAAMARAPARLNLTRGPRAPGNASVGGKRGPNLRAREQKAGGGARKGASGPKKRQAGGEQDKEDKVESVTPEDVLSDGMVQQLLRLQRKEWDRTPYEPKYAPGSFAANQLIHTGREFFRGEAPPVKKWGPLEKMIGVVGMHNAEAHLKVRRVTDPHDDRLGDRREYFESGDVEAKAKGPKGKVVKASKSETKKAPATDAPVVLAQSAAAKVKQVLRVYRT